MKARSRVSGLVLWFFFFSGFSGLVYEVVWARLLERVMGASVYSITTVLTVYMAGLGLGSFLAGRFIDRRRDPLRVYGVLEGAIGVSCVLVPVLLALLAPVYRSAYQSLGGTFQTLTFVRFLISALVLIIPRTLMGATLPVLSRYLATRFDDIGHTVGRLYAMNTFGAVVGSFAAGFVLMPRMGIMGAIFFAAAINIVIAASVFRVGRGGGGEPEAVPDAGSRREKSHSAKEPRAFAGDRLVALVLIAFAVSGFAAMVYQVAWMRALSLVIGSSVYAVSLTLTAYILGLGLGASIVSRLVDRWEHLVGRLGDLQLGIGAAALLVVPVPGKLPLVMISVVERFSGSFGALMAAEFAIVFLVVLIPTLFMGGVFPLVVKICTRRLEGIGRSVGNVYASNTIGAIAGSFVGGFVLVPWLGIQGAISVGVVLSLILGITLTLADRTLSAVRRFAPVGVGIVFLVVLLPLMPNWDPVIMSSGSYLYADMYSQQARAWDVSAEDAVR
ncbi:fused MFS/spermidine synthase, partial [bacterium]|nr:fused MFS/spermidine synthase [bacterium]